MTARPALRPTLVLASALLVATGITGCNALKKSEPLLDANAAPASSLPAGSVEAAIAAAAERMTAARGGELDLHSPGNMQMAGESLANAQKLHSRGKDDEAQQQASLVDSYMRAAEANKVLAQSTLGQAITEREYVKSLGAPERLPRDYAKVTQQFRDIMEILEGGNTGKAMKAQQKLLAQIASLEIDTLKAIYVDPAKAMLDKAKDVDADDFAPATYRAAKTAIDTASRTIETTPKAHDEVKAAGENAVNMAHKALHVSEEARQLLKLDEPKAEMQALRYFSLFKRLNESAGIPGFDAMSLGEQVNALSDLLATQATTNRRSGAAVVMPAPAASTPAPAAPAPAAEAPPAAAPAPEATAPAPASAPADTSAAPAAAVDAAPQEPAAPASAPAPAAPAPSAAAPALPAPDAGQVP